MKKYKVKNKPILTLDERHTIWDLPHKAYFHPRNRGLSTTAFRARVHAAEERSRRTTARRAPVI